MNQKIDNNPPVDTDTGFLNGGAVQDTIDNRDYPFEAFVGADDNFQEIWDWRTKYPIKHKYQGNSWSCVGYTTSSYAELLNWDDTGKYVELSPRWIYAFVSIGMYKGAYTRDGVMRLVSKGDAPESVYSSIPAIEEHLTDKSGVTPAIEALALQYKAKLATTITDKTNFELLKLAIYQNRGITLGIGNHVMYAPAYNKDYIICHDSLTAKDRLISRADVESGKLHSLWTIIDEPNMEEEDMDYKEILDGVVRAVAGRPSDDGDRNFWLPRLESGAVSLEVLIKSFLDEEAKFIAGDRVITVKKK